MLVQDDSARTLTDDDEEEDTGTWLEDPPAGAAPSALALSPHFYKQLVMHNQHFSHCRGFTALSRAPLSVSEATYTNASQSAERLLSQLHLGDRPLHS